MNVELKKTTLSLTKLKSIWQTTFNCLLIELSMIKKNNNQSLRNQTLGQNCIHFFISPLQISTFITDDENC
ncbi:unnamed protein product [Schistosoma bovis]|nr:unnamed protein product [Schistosoma bovis]